MMRSCEKKEQNCGSEALQDEQQPFKLMKRERLPYGATIIHED